MVTKTQYWLKPKSSVKYPNIVLARAAAIRYLENAGKESVDVYGPNGYAGSVVINLDDDYLIVFKNTYEWIYPKKTTKGILTIGRKLYANGKLA